MWYLALEKMLIFVVLKQWLLQQTETEVSFVYISLIINKHAYLTVKYGIGL